MLSRLEMKKLVLENKLLANKIMLLESDDRNNKDVRGDIINFVADNSYLSLDGDYEDFENDTYITFSTRENGDVGEEEYGIEDLKEANNIAKHVENKFNVPVKVETSDEWVSLYIEDRKEESTKTDIEPEPKEDLYYFKMNNDTLYATLYSNFDDVYWFVALQEHDNGVYAMMTPVDADSLTIINDWDGNILAMDISFDELDDYAKKEGRIINLIPSMKIDDYGDIDNKDISDINFDDWAEIIDTFSKPYNYGIGDIKSTNISKNKWAYNILDFDDLVDNIHNVGVPDDVFHDMLSELNTSIDDFETYPKQEW